MSLVEVLEGGSGAVCGVRRGSERQRLAISLPVGIAFALAVYGVFDQLLKLNLPAGFPETLLFGG